MLNQLDMKTSQFFILFRCVVCQVGDGFVFFNVSYFGKNLIPSCYHTFPYQCLKIKYLNGKISAKEIQLHGKSSYIAFQLESFF